MSRVLPNAMVAQAFRKLGIRSDLLEADLPPMVALGLQKLYGFQHNDGGWGWWYDDSTDVNQTAYVLLGLAMTEQAGFEVDDGVMERGAGALNDLLPGADARAQAYGAYVLAMAGRPFSVTLTLTEALGLDLFSQAALAIALDATGDVSATASLLDSLREASLQDATTVHWSDDEDVSYSRKVMGSTVRTTAMVADALARLDPESPLLPGAIRWLMAARQGQGWGDTQKTSFAILALSDYLLATRERSSGAAFQVYVNGELWQAGTLAQPQASQTLILTYTGSLTAGEVVVPGETVTATEIVTAGEAITVSEPVTASQAITAAGAITASEFISPAAVITSGIVITGGEVVMPGERLTATANVTAGKVFSPSLLHPGENQIRVVLGVPGEESAGRLYYAVTMLANRRPGEGGIPALQAQERSIAVEREYRLAGSKESATGFRRGDLVEVRLTLDVPEESWYVVVDDPLPAGFEAVNERLGTASHQAAAYEEPVYHWQYYGYNRKDVRDERVSLFIDQLPPGQHTFTYLMRATTAGTFVALPAQVYPMYEPEVWSRSESMSIQVGPR
jgi:uncharacterized protein YfaS (alpha-2-macroglobulin family)